MSEKQYLEHEHETPDSWHRHTADEGAPQIEHAASINLLGLLIVFLGMSGFLVVTVGLLIVFFDYTRTQARQAKIETTTMAEENSLPYRQESMDALASYGWVDPAAGRVQVPINVAMDRIVEEYATQE